MPAKKGNTATETEAQNFSEKDSQAVADQFMEKLVGKGFVMSRSQNSGENYTKTRQKRDSQAVIEFSKTETAKYIMNL
jgi:hypothetical protein